MGYLEEFGFKIYRLRDAKAENEFLLLNLKNKNYSQYNEKRLIKILLDEFRTLKIDLREFGQEELGLDWKQADPSRLIVVWKTEETVLIDNVGFKPTKEDIFEKENKLYFNTFNYLETFDYNKYKLTTSMSFEEFKSLAPYHYKLLYNLHNKDDNAIKDTLLKLADKIRFPHEKAQDCLIFYPGEGAGKGILYKYVLQPIFQQYANKVLMKKLNSDFNGFVRESLVLVLEEGKRDLELVETLKEAITEGSMLINKKGVDQKEEEVYFLTIVFSNHMNPIDLGKRRGSYHLTHALGRNVDESQTIGAELCEKLPSETEILLKYLHNLEFTHQEALRPYNTKAKSQVNDLNKSPIELFYDYLISFSHIEKALRDLHERRFGKNYFNFAIETFKPRGSESNEFFISKDLFKEGYNNFCYLEGLRSNIIRHNKDIVQLWALFKLNEEAHQRITIKTGVNEGRKIDHIRLKDLQEHIKEVLENE